MSSWRSSKSAQSSLNLSTAARREVRSQPLVRMTPPLSQKSVLTSAMKYPRVIWVPLARCSAGPSPEHYPQVRLPAVANFLRIRNFNAAPIFGGEIVLVRGGRFGTVFRRAFHEEGEGREGRDGEGHYGDDVSVGEGGGLLSEKRGDAAVGLVRGIGHAVALSVQGGGEAFDHLAEARVRLIHVAGEIGLALLGSAGDESGDQSDANAAADIADETDHAGDLIIFLTRDVDIGQDVGWNENERESEHLIDPQHGGG